MLTMQEFEKIRQAVQTALCADMPVPVTLWDQPEVCVRCDGHTAQVGAQSKTAAARGLMLMYRAWSKGNRAFEIHQRMNREHCGILLDMSRNGVMRVDSVKKYLNKMAALGMNMLLLYMEDTCTLPHYPLFGYRRGRYSAQELNVIDDYAFDLGIEVIPAIQTLGHMGQYLKWNPTEPTRDTWECLFCGEEATYQLIDEMISTLSNIFRSRRVYVGLDEAHDMGFGGYFMKHGYRDRFTTFTDHLNRVHEICQKHQLRPIMCSDMFFRIPSKRGEYYDPDVVLPKAVTEQIPDLDLAFWSYGEQPEEYYEHMLKKHIDLQRPVMYMGGIPIWLTLMPDYVTAFHGMALAMRECLKWGIKECIATTWCDDSAETDPFYTVAALPVFSEICYEGAECTQETISDTVHLISGFRYEDCAAIAKFIGDTPDTRYLGKGVYYSDILYNFTNQLDFSKPIARYREALSVLEKAEPSQEAAPLYERAIGVFRFCIAKMEIFQRIRTAYQEGDRAYLQELASKALPQLLKDCRALGKQHLSMWRAEYKVFGSEVLSARYAAMAERLEYASRVIEEYLDGSLPCIEELDYDYIEDRTISPASSYRQLASTSTIM